jgi:AraC family transcriptional regulator
MPEDKPLAIDLTKENQLPVYEMAEYYPAQHVIVTHADRHSFKVERKLDGRLGRDRMINGDIVVVPANVSHGARWNTEININVLILEPTFVARIVYESVDPDCVELIPHFSKPDLLISQIALTLQKELISNDSGSRLYVDSMAIALSAHLLRHYSAKKHTIQDYTGGLPKYKLQQAIEYIHDHLTEGFSLEAIANYIGISQYHFAKLFKQSTGMTPHQYLIETRLEKAKILLAKTDFTISEIAYRTGFANQSHLTRLFRKYLSTTPKAYRQML